MRQKAKQRFGIAFTALALLSILAFNAWEENNSLQKHKKLTVATITSASENINGAHHLRFLYSYSIDRKIYTGQFQVEDAEAFAERDFIVFNYRAFHFPVIYNSQLPEVNKLSITRKDWIKNGIILTDSLRNQYTVIDTAR